MKMFVNLTILFLGISTASFGALAAECVVPDSGHHDYDGWPYDILSNNCHSAANNTVRSLPFSGIVTCGGYPELGDPSNHTFNYKVFPDHTEFYNWGETCTSYSTSVPPDIHDDSTRTCVARFCGDQFHGTDERVLNPGDEVEEPGPLYCSQTESNRSSCESCCRYRGTFWDLIDSPLRPDDPTFIQFMSQCLSACQNLPSLPLLPAPPVFVPSGPASSAISR